MTPFIVLGLPRSRTYWLSRFLSYGAYECEHDQARFVRSMDDIRLWLSQDFTGTAETAAARWWRMIRHIRPDIKIVVVRRPVTDVVESLMRLDLHGVGAFRRDALIREVSKLDRYLNRIEREPNVLSVKFDDLAKESVCKRVFEFCLPYAHLPDRWVEMNGQNLQANMSSMMRYCLTFGSVLSSVSSGLRKQMRRTMGASYSALSDEGGVIIREESLEEFRYDAQKLFAEHCVAVGEEDTGFMGKNWSVIQKLEAAGCWQIITARSNGRMLGYLASIIGPSVESEEITMAAQAPFFVTRDAKGLNLGMKLQRAAIAAAGRRGVNEMYMRAGVRGAGPRMGALYRRLGAEPFGEMYKLTLGAA